MLQWIRRDAITDDSVTPLHPETPVQLMQKTTSPEAECVYLSGRASGPPRRNRLPGFSVSVVLHCFVIAAMWSVDIPVQPAAVHRQYSVRLLQLQTPAEYRPRSPGRASLTAELWSHMSAHGSGPQNPQPAAVASTNAAPGPDVAPERRPFVLPPDVLLKPVKQTLIQPDIPPNLTLSREVPLPAAILWSDLKLPPIRKRFITPPEAARPAAKAVQSVPENAAMIALTQETRPGALNMAGVIPADLPKFHKAFVAPPSRDRQEPIRQVSQIGMLDPNAASGGNLISLPADPVVSGTVALPPANQIASSDVAPGGLLNSDNSGNGSGGNNVSAHTGARDSGRSVAADSGSGTGSAPPKSPGGAQASIAIGSATTGTAATGAWSATGSGGGPQPLAIAGLRRIELPKNGKFGAVVSGSSAAGSYPESAGALSGKVIYTVYIKVGLRKSWILQYCLPKGDEKSARSGVGIDAPWPFLMMRPDQGSASAPDYMILHGTITAAGRFDQLAVIFPADYAEKELLVSSLKLWEFRPAARDGVPVPVEALLIIPHQPE